jgi:ubiquinone/menaquinone biosynthesis C-methylase UbiE
VPERATPPDYDDRVSYDEIAATYERHWGPVIRPGAERVLDHLGPAIEAEILARGEPAMLDVGTGTGTLAIAALERWPALQVTGVDPSSAMLDLARGAAEDRLPAGHLGRYRTEVGWADELPFPDGVFDLAVSSFVLQLVPSRKAALHEIRRVLRPGATFAWVAWQRSDVPYEPDRIANEVLDEAGFDPPEASSRNGDVASAPAAALAMRRAGFREVRAHVDEVAHEWSPAGYLAFLTKFDEAALFDELGRAERRDIEREITRRLRGLTPEQRTLRLPVVHAMGRAPG